LANTAQARKRARQAEKRHSLKAGQRSALRTSVKNLIKLVTGDDKKAAQEAFKGTVSVIDKAVSKDLIHQNNAARQKSRLNARLRGMG